MAEQNRLQWFRIHWTDILTSEEFTCLTDTELGVFLRMAAFYWGHGKLPKMDNGDTVVTDRIRSYAVEWCRTELDAQMAYAKRVSDRNRENIKARWNKKKRTSGIRSNTTAYHREGEGDRELTTTTPASGFDVFWAAYPKKKSKQEAAKWWTKRKPDSALLTKMLNAIAWQRHTQEWTKDGGQYIPLPATWLNKARWDDSQEVEVERPKTDMDRATEYFANRLSAGPSRPGALPQLPDSREDAPEPESDLSF